MRLLLIAQCWTAMIAGVTVAPAAMGYESSIYTASDDYYDNISDDEGEEESLLGDVLITSREKTPEEPGW
jgi:hypothetical protein